MRTNREEIFCEDGDEFQEYFNTKEKRKVREGELIGYEVYKNGELVLELLDHIKFIN